MNLDFRRQEANETFVQLTADIVSAYVANNSVPLSNLGNLINDVHKSLARLSESKMTAVEVKKEPAVPIKKSVKDDAITCLECGKKFKSLKRHLGTHGISVGEYKKEWGLPSSYPMVAPKYAETRSELAKAMGLGRKSSATDATPQKRGRKKKA